MIQLHPNKNIHKHSVNLSSVALKHFFSTQEPMCSSPTRSATILPEPVSQMQLVFDEEDDEGQEEGKCTEGKDPRASTDTSRGPQEPAGNPAPQDPGWDAGGTTCIVVITRDERKKMIIPSHILDLLSVKL